MKRIRVLHILPHLRPGGAERVATYLMCSLANRYDVAAVSYSERTVSDLESLLATSGVPVRYLGKHPGFDPRIFIRAHCALREYRANVVHTHGHVLRYLLPSILANRRSVMVHTVHNTAEHEVEPRAYAYWMQKQAFRLGVVPVAVAHHVAASLERLYGIRNALVVPNAIPVDEVVVPTVPREEWRRREGFAAGEVLFVCVARLAAQKNHALLLNAFARVAAVEQRARLVLVGRGERKYILEQQVAALGIEKRASFLDFRTDIPNVLAAADAFVLSSDWEGNPLAVMEALAAGLPVISTSVGGLPELMQTERHGILTPPGDEACLATAMLRLARNPKERQSMGRAASRHAAGAFDISSMARAYSVLYEKLLAASIQAPC
jgi:glycosyltransferase involved in cell wall biosynthesis